jgi:hypothetical protein
MASSCVRASSLLLRDRSEVSSSLVAAVCWPDNNNKDNPRGVLLQAKTREQAQSRMESLRTECLDVAQTRRQTAGYKAKIKELEIRLEYYRLMGKDRNMALDDAVMRRQQMACLDDGILRLALSVQHSRRRRRRTITSVHLPEQILRAVSPNKQYYSRHPMQTGYPRSLIPIQTKLKPLLKHVTMSRPRQNFCSMRSQTKKRTAKRVRASRTMRVNMLASKPTSRSSLFFNTLIE